MDIVPKESLDIQPLEQESQESIVVPRNVAKAFGRGLKQLISSELQQISFASLRGNIMPVKIERDVATITKVLDGFERAGEVMILTFEGGNDFRFSEGTEEKDPQPGEVVMDKNITPAFTSALGHTLRNSLFKILGRAEGIESEEGKKIYHACNGIKKVLESFDNAEQIEIATDTAGNTKLKPLRTSN